MIVVDLEVPSMRQNYQFSLDEHSTVEVLIAEMTEMIAQKEHYNLRETKIPLELCSKTQERILDRGRTLAQQRIKEADCLILL